MCASDCVKGYYKRAKAHAAVWNDKEARRDFSTVAHLDVTLASLVGRELRALSERMREKYWEEKETYWNMLEKKETENQDEDGKAEREVGEAAEAREESGKGGCPESRGEELPPAGTGGGDEEDASSSEIKPSAPEDSEGKDWQRMLRLVMLLQNEGNFLMKEKRFQDAGGKFKEAVGYVDALQDMVSVMEWAVML